MDKPTITIKEGAEMLGVSLPVMYTLSERAGFPLIRIGRRKVIHKALFIEWIAVQAGGEIKDNVREVV